MKKGLFLAGGGCQECYAKKDQSFILRAYFCPMSISVYALFSDSALENHYKHLHINYYPLSATSDQISFWITDIVDSENNTIDHFTIDHLQ